MATTVPVPTLTRDELQAKLARGDRFKLVMAAGHEWAFRAKHIPGSLHFQTPEQMLDGLDKDEEIVVYCSNVDCRASRAAIRQLLEHGYPHVVHYEGGLLDWESAGLPLEGNWAGDGVSG
jgi:rhodanese-related sulfurtransferase